MTQQQRLVYALHLQELGNKCSNWAPQSLASEQSQQEFLGACKPSQQAWTVQIFGPCLYSKRYFRCFPTLCQEPGQSIYQNIWFPSKQGKQFLSDKNDDMQKMNCHRGSA